MLFQLLVELRPCVPFWRVAHILLLLLAFLLFLLASFLLELGHFLFEVELVQLLEPVHILGSYSVLQVAVLVIDHYNLRMGW